MVEILAVPYMAWLSRCCGGGWPRLPHGIDQWLYALPYLALLYPLIGPWAILAYAGAVLGKRMGHGRGISLKHPMKPGSKPEKIETLTLWLEPYLPVHCYKALILALTGLATTVAGAILCAIWGQPWAAAALFTSGLAKAPAYMIGWAVFDDDRATELAEWLTGAFAGLAFLVFIT